MIASLFLALREGLEAALVVGIVLGALKHTGRDDLRASVWRGVIAAIGFSILGVLVLNLLGARFEGKTEQIFEGITMLSAAGLLTWMIFWMQRQGKQMQKALEAQIKQAANQTGKTAVFFLSFTAVAREGLELALFVTAIQMTGSAWLTLAGTVLGLGIAVALGWGLFTSTYRLNLQQFFRVTNVLLLLFAAGLVAHGVHEFNEAGIIPAIIDPIWDINAWLPEKSSVGMLMTALFGFNGNPSLSEFFFYTGYLIVMIFAGWNWIRPSLKNAAVN